MFGKYLLISSFAISKFSAVSPKNFVLPLTTKSFFASPLCMSAKKVEVPDSSYIDFIGESPFAQKISSLFENKHLSIAEDFKISLDPTRWEDQIAESKGEFFAKITGENPTKKNQLWKLLNQSVRHSIETVSAKLDNDDYPVTELVIKFDSHSIQKSEKPRWHFDHRKAHVLCNLFGDHFTLYRGPAACGQSFTYFYELEKNKLPKTKIVEAPLGKYIFSTQATRPVCHSLPYQEQESGRIIVVLFAGGFQWILENTLDVCAD